MARRKIENPREDTPEGVGQDPTETPNPINFYSDGSDGGDDTQRNFRYQIGYGAILLVLGRTVRTDFKYLWCENFEDFVVEDKQGKLVAYQIKTRQTADGAWKITDEPFVHSLQRFLKLTEGLGEKLAGCVFVSNVDFPTRKKSPKRLFEAIKANTTLAALDVGHRAELDVLSTKCGCESKKVFSLLKNVELIQGPPREEFSAVISHTYIPKLPGCQSFPPEKLNRVRDELFKLVWYASSRHDDSIARHHPFVGSEQDPKLVAKRISISDFEYPKDTVELLQMQFARLSDPLNLSEIHGLEILERKLVQAGLADQVSSMKLRAVSAEESLLTLQQKNPGEFDKRLNQIESKVRVECDDARLQAETEPMNFGRLMLRHLSGRLRQASEGDGGALEGEDFDLMLGVAGLLSDECKVWFNKAAAWEAEQ